MKNYVVSLLFILLAQGVKAQTEINQAWESFFKNDRKSARNLFTSLTQKPETAKPANLSLSLMAELDQSGEQSFDYFKKFYDQSDHPEPYILSLWSSYPLVTTYGATSPKHLEFYNSLLKKKLDGTIYAMANSRIGSYYEGKKKYDLADKAYQQIGSIDNWAITGEFENISTSGFDKTYGVLQKPQADAVFTGKRNLTFGWRKVPFQKHNKWFDFTYYSNYENALVFAQNFVQSPADLSAQLRIGVSGSVKVWVNDRLIISEAEERNNDLDNYISNIKLKQGYNRILVQIGESYAGRSNFLMRITDDTGKPISGLTSTADAQPYTKDNANELSLVKLPAITFFEQQIAKQPNDYLNKILLAKFYLRNDNAFEARRVLEPLKEKFPESTYLNLLYIQLYNLEDNRTGGETLQEAIKTADPESPFALSLIYNDLVAQQDYNGADAIIAKLEAIYGEHENVFAKKIQIAGKRNNQEEIVKLVEAAYAKYPETGNLVWLKYLCEKEIRKNNNAISYLKKYVDEHDNYEFSKYLAKAYFDKGNKSEGLNVFQKEIDNDPVAVGIYIELGNEYYSLQQYDKAEKLYQQALSIAPNSSSYYQSLGKIYEMRKQPEKSIANYQRSLQLNPNNYTAVQWMRSAEGKKDVFEYFEQPDLKSLLAKAPKAADYPDDHTVILDEEVQKVVYENGGSEEKHFYISKVLTSKGLEQLKEYNIPYYNSQDLNVEVAEVLKANGSKTPAEQNGSQIIFTNLEVGDVINLRYKIQNYNQGSMASHFWDSFYFTHGVSYQNTRFSLLVHRNKKFEYTFSQKAIEPTKTAKDEFDLYVWNAEKQDALIYEDKMPPMDDVTNILYLSSIPDWKFVANWYSDIATAKARSSYEIKSVINDLFKGKEKLDELSKIKMIYRYITQNISYSSVSFRQSGIIPQNPATVINTRIGDCKDVSTLFITMCKEAGIKAELALVKTRDNGQRTMMLPNIDFNHCIAKAITNGKEYFVELTSNTLPFATFYNGSLQEQILEINSNTNAISTLNPQQRPKNVANYHASLSFKGNDMMITENSTTTGAINSALRDAYNDLSPKDQIKKFKQDMAAEFPENDVFVLKFIDLDPKTAVSDTLKAHTEYALMKMSKPVAGMSIFSLPWSLSVTASQLQFLQPRKFGIDLTQLFLSELCSQEITMELPAGKKLVEALKPIKVSNEYLDYNLSSKIVGNKVIFSRQLTLKKDFVPVDKTEEFKAAFTQVVDADAQQLAMK
ncbi:tetratricopeptide repeat protein [Pedobacter sp. AW1-32]|uniref:tetratricopeptide repeat protein n=1 Tax=Pedobacter sp. AW1-32 TaxID=3383026 RepID=UPI003FEE2389